MAGKRSKRGSVVVRELRGSLWLRWTYQGDRRELALDLPATDTGRALAAGRAAKVQTDLLTGNYDPTLRKYRSEKAAAIEVVELFQQFKAYKAKALEARSLDKYKSLEKPISDFFGTRSAGSVGDAMADDFRLYISGWMQPVTQKERLITIRACWDWGIKRGLVHTENPWPEVLKRVKVPPKAKPAPFTKAEAQAIIQGFERSQDYSHYRDFVMFLLGTGCRIGEAIGLHWGSVTEGCSKVWIGEAMERGGAVKATKTNKGRRFRVSPKIQAMLQARSQNQATRKLVFPAPRGGHIDDHNFRNRAWHTVLTEVGIPYRKPYNTRSTFISHSLKSGQSLIEVSDKVGSSPKTIAAHYAADIDQGETPPDLF